jgi:putative oxidoreductase
MNDVAILALRVCIAVVFIGHGLQAVFGFFGGPGINGFSQALSALGFKPALLWAYIGGLTELLGGVCVLFGVTTRIAASFILIFISVAAVRVHVAKGFFLQSGGFEYTFVLACLCVALILLGPGKYSVMKKM